MATTKTNLERLKSTKGGVDEVEIPLFPMLPERLLERYPELERWQNDMEEWRRRFMSELNNKISSIKTGS